MFGDMIFFIFVMFVMFVIFAVSEICKWYEKKNLKAIPEEEKGLYFKYNVSRVDGRDCEGGNRENAKYFVLDYVNDPHSVVALRAYVQSLDQEGKFIKLSEDLKRNLDSLERKKDV